MSLVSTVSGGNWTVSGLGEHTRRMKIVGWHSASKSVYHNHWRCHIGGGIPFLELRFGTGMMPLCQECARLSIIGLWN